jgi:hypothetical protein
MKRRSSARATHAASMRNDTPTARRTARDDAAIDIARPAIASSSG